MGTLTPVIQSSTRVVKNSWQIFSQVVTPAEKVSFTMQMCTGKTMKCK